MPSRLSSAFTLGDVGSNQPPATRPACRQPPPLCGHKKFAQLGPEVSLFKSGQRTHLRDTWGSEISEASKLKGKESWREAPSILRGVTVVKQRSIVTLPSASDLVQGAPCGGLSRPGASSVLIAQGTVKQDLSLRHVRQGNGHLLGTHRVLCWPLGETAGKRRHHLSCLLKKVRCTGSHPVNRDAGR